VGIPLDAWSSPVGLQNVSQVGLEQASGGTGTLLFSQCNVGWRSFLWARGSGCQSFDSPCCFISAKSGPSISAIFLIYGAHAVCFCAIFAILVPPSDHFQQPLENIQTCIGIGRLWYSCSSCENVEWFLHHLVNNYNLKPCEPYPTASLPCNSLPRQDPVINVKGSVFFILFF
jgi:hypothetical protein